MRILLNSPGQDTGGQSFRIKQAFDRHAPDWTVRSVVSPNRNYIQYPRDMGFDPSTFGWMYDAADLVHFHNRLFRYAEYDGTQKKPVVLHHHGTRMRTRPVEVSREATSIGASQVVSTIDLAVLNPKATWIPAPSSGADMARWRHWRRRSTIRIVHSPTNRGVKGTHELLESVNRLSRNHDIEFDLVEGVSWNACLSRKGKADIFVDQLFLGYGNNAVEAWGMGIPVVAGVTDQRVRARMIEDWGELPFMEATPETLDSVLLSLIESSELRTEWADRGAAHFARYHEETAVVEKLQTIWKATPKSKGIKSLRLAD